MVELTTRAGAWRGLSLLASAMLTIGALAAPASAQDDVDAHLWAQVVATLRPADDWRLHVEVQPRWFQNVSAPFQILGRTAVGRRTSDRLTVWGGYAYVAKPPGPGIAHEHRSWQQLSASLPALARWSPSLRLRVEQRTQANWPDWSNRARLMARLNRPISDDRKWSVGLWNETTVTFDSTARGPRRGFDQNRTAALLMRQVNRQLSVDAGYMHVRQAVSNTRTTHAHVALIVANVTP